MELSMVTIKIQSADDIALAYLESLGFSEKQKQQILANIMDDMKKNPSSGDDIVAFMDKKCLIAAKKIFNNTKLNNEQMVAQLKLCYLMNDGAKKWGDSIFDENKITPELINEIQDKIVIVAPEFKMSHMGPQEIKSVEPKNLFQKIFHKFCKAS